MNVLISWILTNFLFCVGSVIAFIACIGFLIFLRGFPLSLNHLFYIDGHDDHVGEARHRVSWGTVMMINMFVLWVAIRAIATLIGYDNANLAMTGEILGGYAIMVAFLYFTGLAFAKSTH